MDIGCVTATQSMPVSWKCTGLCAGATRTLLMPICRNTSTDDSALSGPPQIGRSDASSTWNVLRLIKLWLRVPVEERVATGIGA